ncbi:MAG: hypothetical protein ABTQ34_03535 [Bdellovibrionales bacterium]
MQRPVPYLQPVATIRTGGTGPYGGRPEARIYPLPNGQLVRLRLKDDNTYDYKNATFVPETHPVYQAHRQNPDKHIDVYPALDLWDDTPPNKEHPAYREYAMHNVRLVILSSEDRERGTPPNDRDIAWLKKTLEAQYKRARIEAKALGLIP